MLTKNILIAQSGGPSAAINSSLAGIINAGLKNSKINRIYGALNGIAGVLDERIIDINEQITSDEDIDLLKITPAMALGSCRVKLPDLDKDSSIYEKIEEVFLKYNIGYFFYIGGNDSMDTTNKLAIYFKKRGLEISVIGVPKTIDNDLPCTDHTPGFGSAAKYIATTIKSIARDSQVYNVPSVTIIEIMGRNAGWLTASSALATLDGDVAPHLVYLCEIAFDPKKFINDVKDCLKKDKNIIVAVSEGVKNEDGEYAASSYQSGKIDAFGHKYLSGVGAYLEKLVTEEIGCKVRSVELNVPQRCAGFLLSKTDIDEAFAIGEHALHTALNGETGKIIVIERTSNQPYLTKISSVDVKNVANKEKKFPKEWICDNGTFITKEAFDYLVPLIQGEIYTPTKNGLPIHFQFKK